MIKKGISIILCIVMIIVMQFAPTFANESAVSDSMLTAANITPKL